MLATVLVGTSDVTAIDRQPGDRNCIYNAGDETKGDTHATGAPGAGVANEVTASATPGDASAMGTASGVLVATAPRKPPKRALVAINGVAGAPLSTVNTPGSHVLTYTNRKPLVWHTVRITAGDVTAHFAKRRARVTDVQQAEVAGRAEVGETDEEPVHGAETAPSSAWVPVQVPGQPCPRCPGCNALAFMPAESCDVCAHIDGKH